MHILFWLTDPEAILCFQALHLDTRIWTHFPISVFNGGPSPSNYLLVPVSWFKKPYYWNVTLLSTFWGYRNLLHIYLVIFHFSIFFVLIFYVKMYMDTILDTLKLTIQSLWHWKKYCFKITVKQLFLTHHVVVFIYHFFLHLLI